MIIIICISLINLIVYLTYFWRATVEMHLYPLGNSLNSIFSKVSVIIPAYNEADNIRSCVISILKNTALSADKLEVWVVDDQSTDDTLNILNNLKEELNDSRLKILPGLPRPVEDVWMGKNWACTQGAEQTNGEFLLFIDADVQLKPKAIETVIELVESEQIDLLNCIPALNCKCLAEWLVQPLIFINLLVSLNSKVVKDPSTQTTFAAGPFLLFRRSAYEAVGGHRAVANKVAEDVALARLIKHKSLKLQHILGSNLAQIRMYRSWTALWEGWTKVLYSGAQRSVLLMIYLALLMLSIYSIPWLVLLIVLGKNLLISWQTIDLLTICLALIAICLQYNLRTLAAQAFCSSPKYWWLHWLGGLLVAIMAIASVIKTETGWGWTWRGRSLKQPS